MLQKTKSQYSGYVNTYVADMGPGNPNPKWNFDKLFVVTTNPNKFVHSSPHFHTTYLDKPSKNYVLVMNIPDEFENDYSLFLDGKYSQFSQDYKDTITDRILTKPIDKNFVYRILYKPEIGVKELEKRIGQKIPENAEILDKPHLDQEILNYHQI